MHPCMRCGGIPATTGPPRLVTRAHSPLKKIPFRVSHCLLAVRLRLGRTDSPELLRPCNGNTRVAPYEAGCPAHLGSAHRFSQPLSGFLARPELRGLVPCRNRSWDSSLQSCPLAGIAHPSRSHVLPGRYPPACQDASPGSSAAGFADSHALQRSCLVPPTPTSPEQRSRRCTSRSPEPRAA
jgi:hypothetical protein